MVWFNGHRHEIVEQNSDALNDYGVPHGLVVAGQPTPRDRILVCSIGTLRNRHHTMPAPDLIIWDEAHHLPARTWADIHAAYPGAKHVGLTATPCRLDGKGLGEFFDTLIGVPSVSYLIKHGYNAPWRLFAPDNPDLSGIKIQAGDYVIESLEDLMNDPILIGNVIEHFQEKAGGKALVFCVSVKHSEEEVRRFQLAGYRAVHVDWETPKDERKARLADLEAGRIDIISSVTIFTEGLNTPTVDCIVILRPTKSLGLFRQLRRPRLTRSYGTARSGQARPRE